MGKKRSEPARLGKALGRILLILLISLLLGSAVYSINARRVLHNAMPMPFGVGVSVVLSGSMEPTLSVNDVVVVAPAEDYSVDDVVVYQSGSDLIIHRVVAKTDDVFVTQGDANNTPDDPISAGAIKGKLLFHIPFVGILVRVLQTTLGRLVLIAAAFLLLLRSWRKEREDDQAAQDRIKEEIRKLKADLEQSKPSDGPLDSNAPTQEKESNQHEREQAP